MKFKIYFAIVGLLTLGLVACESDLLDPKNPSAISEEDVWSDENLIELLVNQMYNDRPGYEYANTQDNITDEGRCNYTGDAPNQILRGQWDQTFNPLDFWAYQQVRRTNEFLAKIENANVEQETKKRLRGEARFLRVFLYFDMVKRYGGVPIIKTPQDISDDLMVKRATISETFDFIVSELKIAKDELPSESLRGRASSGAAMALLGRVLVFAASPLYNENNDNELWDLAAEVNKELIDLNRYSLYPDLNKLWLDRTQTHPEVIFEIQYKLPEKQHSWDAGLRPLILANNNAGQLSPLQEMIDAFPMKNGKGIKETGSGYRPDDPYTGRDDRFYAFIAFNGSKMKGTTSGPPIREITLETYTGGRDYDASKENTIYNTITSYYTRKATDPDNTIYTGSTGSDQPWIELRYAEVLLNYAEAKNEALSSPDVSVYTALNTLRKRAGISSELVMGSLNKTQMRELIRNERYVEFCFEKKRYWDLRRWKMAENMLNGKKYHGALITKQSNGSFSYAYPEVDPTPIIFENKMYFMPIPQGEIDKNPNLEQNEGW